ncbi:metal-dependent hydrolase [Clostridium formicaceticum]|uniref:Inner membrane protein n=1 Tax=Clostridium formicaceticum TaxID=1497 RepID=A0AAC9WF79_9CLOT|nr:metal-dependent hydrolase [Clostridium formicaceticum]AOY76040.1 metal-dependent hydrolase [Clostridium formicaceticum]ARE86399.1 inner membrane protein [Clostridium formicaceticum]
MLGRTHIALGLTTALFTATFIGISAIGGSLDTMALGMIVIAALLPDLDMGTSSLGGKFGILKAHHIKKLWLLVLIVLGVFTVVYLQETPIFYGILFVLLLGSIFAKDFAQKGYHVLRNFTQGMVGIGFIAAAYFYQQPPLVGIGIILLILLLSKHRGLSHSIVFVLLNYIIVKSITTFYDYKDYSLLFTMSMASHIVGDMFTRAGVMLFYPFSQKKIKFPFTIKTGGKLENLLFFATCLLAFKLIKSL